jgi:hypothetical protein
LNITQYGELDESIAVRRRERGFSTYVARNKVNKNLTTNPNIFATANLDQTLRQFTERLRDRYLNVDFIYQNLDNYKFNIPYVKTLYRQSTR